MGVMVVAMKEAWELSPAGGGRFTYSLVYVPIGGDRFQFPHGGVVLDSQENLYAYAGSDVVAEFLKAQGYAEQILWDSQSCGSNPCPGGSYDTVSMDKTGNLYWTTYTGSQTYTGGTVDELSPDGQGGWNFTVLHTFPTNPPSEGTAPYTTVMIDASGNLYGTNSGGGTTGSCTSYPYCNGTVWEIVP